MPITDEKYMSFTTYRRTGEAVTAPVWVVPVSDGRVGFWTAMGSGKTKRLRNNPTIAAQPSDARGKIKEGTSRQTGTAELIQSGPLFDEVQGKIKKKYGVMVPISKYAGRLMGQRRSGQTYADTVVLVRLDG